MRSNSPGAMGASIGGDGGSPINVTRLAGAALWIPVRPKYGVGLSWAGAGVGVPIQMVPFSASEIYRLPFASNARPAGCCSVAPPSTDNAQWMLMRWITAFTSSAT